MATFSMSDTQQSVFSITATDKKGNPATMPTGSIVWAVDQASLLTLTPAADNLTCVVVAVGPLGMATVSVKVVDPGGNTLAAGSIDVTITGGTATVISITGAAPTEQP